MNIYNNSKTSSNNIVFRFLSLNETVLKQTDQITKLQVALTNKELEVQQAQAQLTAPRTELEFYKLEKDDLKKRLAEAERRYVYFYLTVLFI